MQKMKFRAGRASYKIDMPTMSSILEAEQDGAAIGMRMAASVTQIGWLSSLNSCGRRRLRQPHFTGGNRSPLRGVFLLDAFGSASTHPIERYTIVHSMPGNKIRSLCVVALLTAHFIASAQVVVQHAVPSQIVSAAPSIHSLNFTPDGYASSCYPVYPGRSVAGPTLNSLLHYQAFASSAPCTQRLKFVDSSVSFQPTADQHRLIFVIDRLGQVHLQAR
ncbi:hypothetical protein [Xanthomonas oryzae]|uniref:hypothetical protein n=2 Tax=Xanthomonas oryzae TaxID=347 RepID=UPI00102F22E2|nr:hypothetical protein [Xanthomonas oryzae]QBI11933.1 hypothetical protein EYR02_07480 [Xanthomonas oryzae pv. oryzae]QBI15489.1 hypothetical protein EYR03_07220 [Xanthomonas oryzae pv. oryzae]TAO91202.1 hypothetical protein EYR05_07220 [Xanthomonas oryzae pv. oryzae]TAP11230.1 hypothetical protein EYR04_07175 [Xanthomonas oryzae pv. oryzae]TAP21650.1 hypothetical protein EYR01_09010 [Xanthomonas oryzae pv. oryzae]